MKLAWAAAPGRVALVTDATAAAGLGSGTYQLGDVEIEVSGTVARRADGVLAGTVITMIEAVRNLHTLGVPFVEAVAAATAVPARIIRRPDVGVLTPGGRADAVVLDDTLSIVSVVCGEQQSVVV